MYGELTMGAQSRGMVVSDVMLLAVAVVWGTSYGVAKEALLFYSVLGLLALRFGLTFLLLSPTLRHLRGLPRRQAWHLIGTGGLLLCIFLCETFGVLHTTASNAAFLISLNVILTLLVEWAMLKRRPLGREVLAVFVSLVGAALLAGAQPSGFGLGEALVVLAAAFRAVQVCWLKRLNRDMTLPALTVTAVQAGTVAVGSGMLLLLTTPPMSGVDALVGSFEGWGYILYLVLACTLFAFFAQNYALKRSDPTRVAVLMGSEPLFGAVFAVYWLGETVTLSAWVGGGLIVVACLLTTVRWQGRRRQPELAA